MSPMGQITGQIRVLIADDEALIRHALRTFISWEAGLEVVGDASDGIEAVAAARRLRPDVVLMDLRMPAMGGIEAIATITRDLPEVRVLAVTTFASEGLVVQALRAGASGYLVKDSEPSQVTAAIREVHEGGTSLSPHIAQDLIRQVTASPTATDPAPSASPAPLTPRERSIVELLGRGLSNAEIAAELHLAEPTVKANLGRVIAKWGVRDRIQVLVHAVSHGIIEIGAHERGGEAATAARPR